MAESKELSTPIKGGILSNPKDLKQFMDKLKVSIDLAQAALKQKGIDPNKYKEILEKGQEWAGLKLEAELKLKDFIESIPSGAGRPKSNISAPRDKNKADIRKELGLTDKQIYQIKKLTPFSVKQAIKQSKEDGDIPTRYSAIKLAKIERERSNLESSLNGAVKASRPTKIKQYSMIINIKTSTNRINKKLLFDDKEDFEEFYNGLTERFEEYVNYHAIKKTPFNYTGSKARLIPQIYPHIKNHENIVSPFLGGGSFEIYLANRGHNVTTYDYSPDISNMWIQIQNNSDLLKNRIQYFISEKVLVSKTEEYRQTYNTLLHDYFDGGVYTDNIDKAAIYWILLMGSFGAKIVTGNASSDFYYRLKPGNVDRIKHFDGLTFGGRISFEESIPKHPNDFLYCDPPYMLDITHYGVEEYNPELHRDFDHHLLAEVLNSRKNWILSYNNVPEIRKLYKGHEIMELKVGYKLSNQKDGKEKIGTELLIFG
ncbi:hypothetical protein AGMMS50268_22580 [Spirochaetia bacterium]|nr:hypothetical protein AGMMS50268_22580 [Spirochaetia bacterium]